MKKWYNFETSFVTLANDLPAFLKRSGIYYERSGAFGNYRFEVLADMGVVAAINAFLDAHTIQAVHVRNIVSFPPDDVPALEKSLK